VRARRRPAAAWPRALIASRAGSDWNDDYNGPPSSPRWRSIFTLVRRRRRRRRRPCGFARECVGELTHARAQAPDTLFDNFAPVFLGLVGACLHVVQLRWEWAAQNWVRLFCFHIFAALFGCFGYTGNLGIVIGFFTVAAAAGCLIMVIFAPRERTTLNISISKA
jgi:hypothetical protein